MGEGGLGQRNRIAGPSKMRRFGWGSNDDRGQFLCVIPISVCNLGWSGAYRRRILHHITRLFTGHVSVLDPDPVASSTSG